MNEPQESASELISALTALGWEFPFERELSLGPLIKFWDEAIATEDSIRGRLARTLTDEVHRVPELSSPINNLSVLARHRELVEALMSAVFPTVLWQQEHAAALIPFELRSFYATPSFERDLTGSDGKLRGRLSVDKDAIARFRLLNAYSLALARIYGISFPVDHPIIFTDRGRRNGARPALQDRVRGPLHRRGAGDGAARARSGRARAPRGTARETSRRSPRYSPLAASGSAASPCSGRWT